MVNFVHEEVAIPEINAEYLHMNRKRYRIKDIGRSSNDHQQILVIYESLEEGDFPAGSIWVRPLNDFMKPGRFTKITKSLNDLV